MDSSLANTRILVKNRFTARSKAECEPPPSPAAMVEAFGWTGANGLWDNLQTIHRLWADKELDRTLELIGKWDAELSSSIRVRIEQLPAWSRRRFATAPETIQQGALLRNRRDPAARLGFIRDSLDAERGLALDVAPSRPVWTAFGDAQVGGSSADGASLIIFAPRFGSGIPIDVASPHAKNFPQHSSLIAEPHTSEELIQTCHLLETALSGIAAAAGSASAMIDRCVGVIVARKCRHHRGSSSERSFPGRVLIRNIHSNSAESTASALVHEAIHQALFIVEHSGEFISRAKDLEKDRVQSPWSGNSLALHSYFHACFVWYGLTKFWRLAVECGAFDEAEANKELATAQLGFQICNPADRLRPFLHACRRDAFDAVDSLRDRVLSETESTTSR